MAKTITLKPGDSVTIRCEQDRRIQDPDGRYVLPVAWISQHGPTAKHAPGDCGPASVAMAIHYLTDESPTVDQVSVAGDVPRGAKWSSLRQLATAARCFGLTARHVRPLTKEQIIREITAGRPVLALVKYDILSTQDDPNQDDYSGAHFVLVVGHSARSAIFHDPDRLSGDDFGEFREKPWALFLAALGSTSKTAGNTYDNHGMTFNV